MLKVRSEVHLGVQIKAINDKRLWSLITICGFTWDIILQCSYLCHHCHNYHHQSSRYASGKPQGKIYWEIITFTQEKDGEAHTQDTVEILVRWSLSSGKPQAASVNGISPRSRTHTISLECVEAKHFLSRQLLLTWSHLCQGLSTST